MAKKTDSRGRATHTSSPTMAHAAERYLSDRERSKSTSHIVSKLAPFWGQFRLEEVTQRVMDDYAKGLADMAQATRARMCRQARTVYLFGCREFDLAPKGIKVPTEGRHRVEFLTKKEVTKLLEGLTDEARAIATFMVYTGARYCEARLVEADDLKQMGTVLMCRLRHRKGRETLWRERWVPVHPQVEDAIRLHGSATGVLWRNSLGGQWHQDAAALRNQMKRVSAKLGFEARPHVLRHTFGTLLAKEGGDLRILAELMGHASLQQTRSYINAGNQEAAKLVGKL